MKHGQDNQMALSGKPPTLQGSPLPGWGGTLRTAARRARMAALLLLAGWLLAGCLAEDGVEGFYDPNGGGDTWVTIQSSVISGCSCHNSAPGASNGNISFSTYAGVFGVTSVLSPSDWVVATTANGGAGASTLYKVAVGTLATPTFPNAMVMSDANVTRIADWIDAGAPEQ